MKNNTIKMKKVKINKPKRYATSREDYYLGPTIDMTPYETDYMPSPVALDKAVEWKQQHIYTIRFDKIPETATRIRMGLKPIRDQFDVKTIDTTIE